MQIQMPASWPATLDDEAYAAGISPLVEIRQIVVDQRDAALKDGRMEAAVVFTHLTWWLSRLTEVASGDL